MDSLPRRFAPLALIAAIAAGCEPSSLQTTPTTIPATPESVLKPRAVDEAPPPAGNPDESKSSPTEKEKTGDAPTPTPAPAPAGEAPTPVEPSTVELKPLRYDAYKSQAIVHPGSKLTVVDVWATWCTPCMENFPHLVAMDRKYADQGLVCVSLSLDFHDDPKSIARAQEFLNKQKATFLNVLLDEEQGDAFEKLDLTGIPAVLIYDPAGNEIRRFTGDDPDRPFTYDQVEDVVARLLKGETLPDDAPGEVYKPR